MLFIRANKFSEICYKFFFNIIWKFCFSDYLFLFRCPTWNEMKRKQNRYNEALANKTPPVISQVSIIIVRMTDPNRAVKVLHTTETIRCGNNYRLNYGQNCVSDFFRAFLNDRPDRLHVHILRHLERLHGYRVLRVRRFPCKAMCCTPIS